ncbi:MAG: hypothetical protein ACLGHC_01870 [Alphaproteobacteria bacterium]
MSRLSTRLEKLESGGDGAAYVPAPAAFVRYAGPRDPGAIVRALGLDGTDRLMVSVLAEGSGPDDPPRLVDEVTHSGHSGMTKAQGKFVDDVSRAYQRGGAWSFYWQRDGGGWRLDQGGVLGE